MTDGRGKKKKAERKIRSDRKKTDRQREREREREREETKNERKGENPEKAISADPVISEREKNNYKVRMKKTNEDECKHRNRKERNNSTSLPHEDHELAVLLVLITP